MKIFDTHTHVFPDKIAAKTLAALSKLSGNLPYWTEGTFDSLASKAIDAGYSGWMNCPVATRPGQAEKINIHAAEHNHWPSLSLGGLHPLDSAPIDIVHQILDLGLHGIKFHPEYQEFNLLDKGMEAIWTECENKALPVLIHAGNDIGFKPPYHSKPADFKELSRRHQGLTIVAAHMGGWLCWNQSEDVYADSKYELYIDTSFSMPYMEDKSQFLRIIRAIGAKHVLFGTDSPWQDLQAAINDVKNCGLTQDELNDIFWLNAQKVWKNIPELKCQI